MTAGLELQGLSVGYRKRRVLRDITLAPIAAGSLVAVVGPNGAGKSTLLKAIAGLLSSQGRILLDGEDLGQLRVAERMQRVGYLPQALPQSSALIAYESILAGLRAAKPEFGRREAEHAVEQVFDALELRPLALRRLSELSGGQRQLIGLAQVVARQPRLLLLDEPTSALDLRWQLQVLETVRGLARRRETLCLMAVHDLNLALRFCDFLCVVGEGGLLAAGPAGEVLDAALLARAYGVEGRVEQCSLGYSMVLVDRRAATT